ncbi:M23 family metallopeptidase [Streptomyces cavernicola]|uniref:M23 family metallopeptidase n=1 Tax=Streptomyces cavernicola TaxID=3043613 RepID=A0ABT6SBB9_9ACTN|nr:M23 family metallopeptidase [Streptomyces sp. B-S-A6]MDI3405496.1 M23 family metallopeptidase [Streptomyces sp. B-S-A6]
MNDQHGYAAGYDGYTTGAFDTTSFDADPLFGTMPGETGSYDAGQSGQWDSNQWASGGQAAYDPYAGGATQQAGMQTGLQDTALHDNTPHDAGSYATGSYDTTAMWATGGYQPLADIPAQPGPQAAEQWDATGQWQSPNFEQPTGLEHGQTYLETGAYDATAWNVDGATPSAPAGMPTDAYDAYGTTTFGAQNFDAQNFDAQNLDAPNFDSSGFDSAGFDSVGFDGQAAAGVGVGFEAQAFDTQNFDAQNFGAPGLDPSGLDASEFQTQAFDASMFGQAEHIESVGHVENVEQPLHDEHAAAEHPTAGPEFDQAAGFGHDGSGPSLPGQVDAADAADAADEPLVAPVDPAPRSRSRRRAPAKRSALLTVAVPSVCALGVAGIAAASVAGGMSDESADTQTQAAPDPTTVKPSTANNKLDTQLANLSADADDFADRASRTQERIDLKERQEAERKRKAAEAARKEAMRPKFALPVEQRGLSSYYGQSGINWMSTHSGIDFPVSYGTPVMAAADGTVRTQWNPAYGNMVIVTAADGTELWYCHLSSTKIRSGSVKAGDTIAYSGNSGNSTGPHLHFEVRPGGGSTIDPLPWLRSHGLDPT